MREINKDKCRRKSQETTPPKKKKKKETTHLRVHLSAYVVRASYIDCHNYQNYSIIVFFFREKAYCTQKLIFTMRYIFV